MSDIITRRTFVKAAGAVAAGAALLHHAEPAQAGEFTGKIKKAVKYAMIGAGDTAEEKLQIIKAAGFEGVEPTVGDKVDPAELKEASAKVGIPIHGVVNGSVVDIPKAIDRAVLYGADSVLLVAGRVNEDMPYAKNYIETQAAIRDAIPYAAERKIQLLLENVWNYFLITPLEYARYIDELDSEWVAAYFDIGNVARFGWAEHWIPVLGDRIKKLDVKPYSRKRQMDEGPWKGFDILIGDEGDMDWAAIRAELKAINYTGWATAEVGGGDAAYLTDLAKRMDRALDI